MKNDLPLTTLAGITGVFIPATQWVWYGFPGHFIAASRCAYHLCTRIGGYLISTVGAHRLTHDGPLETLGLPEDSFYEMMIFPCDGEDEQGNPRRGAMELYREYFSDSLEAERAHREMCEQIAQGWRLSHLAGPQERHG
jgi:hypothetical protein